LAEPSSLTSLRAPSAIYQQLPEKVFEQYRNLTGAAMRYLNAGLSEKEVLKKLTAST
jgi:hypothetical protein